MTLIHADTGQPATPEVAEAAERAERIRRGISIWADTLTEIAAAYQQRDWHTLGYPSWEEYVAGEFGTDRIRLDRDQRREVVASLRAEHLSTRAIAAVVGAAQSTVVSDLEATDQNRSVPEKVLSVDGRARPATRPARVEPTTPPAATAEPPDAPAPPPPSSHQPPPGRPRGPRPRRHPAHRPAPAAARTVRHPRRRG